MADDRTASRELFVASLKQAKTIGMKKGVIEAQAALRRLDRNRSLGIGPPNPPDP
jgi:hypothetical protein